MSAPRQPAFRGNERLRSAAVAGLVATVAFPNPAVSAAGPSFDCRATRTTVETAICGDDELSRLDAGLGATFAPAYAAAGDMKPALLAGQRAWLAGRAGCSAMFPDAASHGQALACLRSRYIRRIAFLKRPVDFRAENICHTLADAITFAKGYAGSSRFYSLIDDAENDVLGAIHPAVESRDQTTALAQQADRLDPRGKYVEPFFATVGPKGRQIFTSAAIAGTLGCQDIDYYAIGPDGTLASIAGPPGIGGGCREGLVSFADLPGGGPDVRAGYVQETSSLFSVTLEIGAHADAKWAPLCEVHAAYLTELGPVHAACKTDDQCGDLPQQALALAADYDRMQATDRSPPASLRPKPSPYLFEEQTADYDFPDHELPDVGKPLDEGGQFWSFEESGELAFTLRDTDRVFRISHGFTPTHGGVEDDGYVVGVYRQSPAGLEGVAALAVEKKRVDLSGPVRVVDHATPLDPARVPR